MIRTLLLAASAVAIYSATAHAYTINVDTTLPTNATFFNSYIGDSGSFSTTLGTFSGSGTVYAQGTGAVSQGHVDPGSVGAYMGVPTSEELLLSTPTTTFSILWGSVDGLTDGVLNGLSLGNVQILGTAITPFIPAGTSPYSAWVTISGLPEFTLVQFDNSNPGGAFEYKLGGMAASAVPEPSTWLLLALGLFGLAGMGYSQKVPRSI